MQTMKRTWREAATLIVVARDVSKNVKFDYKLSWPKNRPLIGGNLIVSVILRNRCWHSREPTRPASCPTRCAFQAVALTRLTRRRSGDRFFKANKFLWQTCSQNKAPKGLSYSTRKESRLNEKFLWESQPSERRLKNLVLFCAENSLNSMQTPTFRAIFMTKTVTSIFGRRKSTRTKNRWCRFARSLTSFPILQMSLTGAAGWLRPTSSLGALKQLFS